MRSKLRGLATGRGIVEKGAEVNAGCCNEFGVVALDVFEDSAWWSSCLCSADAGLCISSRGASSRYASKSCRSSRNREGPLDFVVAYLCCLFLKSRGDNLSLVDPVDANSSRDLTDNLETELTDPVTPAASLKMLLASSDESSCSSASNLMGCVRCKGCVGDLPSVFETRGPLSFNACMRRTRETSLSLAARCWRDGTGIEEGIWPSDFFGSFVRRARELCGAGSELGRKPHEVSQAAAMLLSMLCRC